MEALGGGAVSYERGTTAQARRNAAESIMLQMEQFAPRLVQQAKLVSDTNVYEP